MKYVVFLPVFQEPVKEQRYMDIINNFITSEDQIVEVYKFVNVHPHADERYSKTRRENNERIVRKADKHSKLAQGEIELLYFKDENLYRKQYSIWDGTKYTQSTNTKLILSADNSVTPHGQWKRKEAKPLFTSSHPTVAYQLTT